MNYKIIFTAIIILTVRTYVPAQLATGGVFSIDKTVAAGGGVTSAGGDFSLTGTAGQNAAGTNTADLNLEFQQIGGFWTPEAFQPTAAGVSVGGTVKNLNGSGIKNILVAMIDERGVMRTIITNPLGKYRFTDVEAGQTYVVTVAAKKYTFETSTRVVTVEEELSDLDFIARQQ